MTRLFVRSCLCVVLLLFASCDSADMADAPTQQGAAAIPPIVAGSPEYVQARKKVDDSSRSNSIDGIFARLASQFDGFGGIYENENHELVLVSKQPELTGDARNDVVAEFFQLIEIDDRSRDSWLSKEIHVQPAAYGFTELAVYRELIESNLRGKIPLVLTDVDERQNVVVMGLDEVAGMSTEEAVSRVTQLGIPSEAVVFEQMAVPIAAINMSSESESTGSSTTDVTDYYRPLAGGLKIDRGGGCSLGIPVWYGDPGEQTRGFLTASHCTGYVGYDNNSEWGQPLLSSDEIGIEQEDPPLTNCGSGSTNCHLVDAALIDINNQNDNSSDTYTGQVHLTDFSSSTGFGGFEITQQTGQMWTQSPIQGTDVNKVGKQSGWTDGEITGTCVNLYIDVRHPDGVERPTYLPCYIKADTPVAVGDSGSALFSLLYDPELAGGGFQGILSACSGCSATSTSTVAYYVSWGAINSAMSEYITLTEDEGGA